MRQDGGFEGIGVLLAPAPAFFKNRLGVVTGMVMQRQNDVAVNLGSVGIEPERGAKDGESVIEQALLLEDGAEIDVGFDKVLA